MTDRPHVGHSTGVQALATAEARLPPPVFDTVYAEHFAFVWRTLRRFGVDAHGG